METHFQINVLKKEEEFFSLCTEWEMLIQRSEEVSIFESWEWQYYWWKYYGKNQSLYLITVRKEGQLLGILPLYLKINRIFKILPVKVLQFVGTGGDTSPEYLGPIVDRSASTKIIDTMMHYVFTSISEWDVLNLSEISAQSVFYTVLKRFSATKESEITIAELSPNAYIALPSSWDDFIASLSSKRRYKMRRMRRGFMEATDARFFVWEDKSHLQSAIDHLISLHHMRWNGRGEHSFSSSEYIGFHSELMHALIKKDCLRLYCLQTEGKIIAMDYCYRWNKEIMAFQRGFDPNYEKLSPGHVLLGFQIEHAIDEHNRTFDLLRGDHEYKRYLYNNVHEKVMIKSFQPRLMGTLYRIRTEYIPNLKKLIKNKLSVFSIIRFRKMVKILHPE